jgi:transposase InsO family protein
VERSKAENISGAVYHRRMKKQIGFRLGLPHVLDVLAQFCGGTFSAEQACESLGIGQTRLYELRSEYLKARAEGTVASWQPRVSGGNHATPWEGQVTAFLREALDIGYNYSFAASEADRQFGVTLARSQVRHWAIREGVRPAPKPPRLPAHLRRWQRQSVGELWQLDATPDRWFGNDAPAYPLLDMIDDCSRLQVGCAIYRHENVPAYLHFLHNAFMEYGLPLHIYVDQAGVFTSNKEDGVTRIGQRLKFYDVSFIVANTPEAKGKVERIHQVWQDRLPPYFALNGVTAASDLEEVNSHICALREHRNRRERHREIRMVPQEAWDRATEEKRNKLRPVPKDPWWNYVWSSWYSVTAMPGGRVHFRTDCFPTQAPAGTRAVLCEHLDGTVSILKESPQKGKLPIVLFSNRPR